MKRATNAIRNSASQNYISIHALVKRATIDDYAAHGDYDISIHALVKRATLSEIIAIYSIPISIHALVKRATCRGSVGI